MRELFNDARLHEAFLEINRNLAEMNGEIKSLRKELSEMNELWKSHEQLREEFRALKQQLAGRNHAWESIRLWGAFLVALAALILNLVRG